MIILAVVYRVHDGLALSATTDVESTPAIKECQKYAKLLSRKFVDLPDRCFLSLEGFCIYFVSALNVSFLVLCKDGYPAILAFSFLEEIQKEFLIQYEIDSIKSLTRPYSLIDFSSHLQRSRQRYNSPNTLNTKLNLSELSTELRLRPPYQVTRYDIEFTSNGHLPTQYNYRPTVVPDRTLAPLQWYEKLCVAVCVLTVILNSGRAMALISHGHWDDTESFVYLHSAALFMSALLSVSQIYLTLYYSKWRGELSMAILLTQLVNGYFLMSIRHIIQTLFHTVVAFTATVIIFNRQLNDKLPDYNV